MISQESLHGGPVWATSTRTSLLISNYYCTDLQTPIARQWMIWLGNCKPLQSVPQVCLVGKPPSTSLPTIFVHFISTSNKSFPTHMERNFLPVRHSHMSSLSQPFGQTVPKR